MSFIRRDSKRDLKKDDPKKKKKFRRKKVCRICVNPDINLNYKDIRTLSFFITDKGKIVSRRISGICAFHQRQLGSEIKRARNLALLPFVVTNL
jgi:small subunit ribosomal protein S18